MRLFVALEVPEDVVRRLDAAVGSLRDRHGGLRWSRPEAWHVTLAFLGEVDEHDVDRAVAAAGRGVARDGELIHLSLGSPGHFNRRVLWVGVDDEPRGAVSRLGAAIQHEVLAEALPCDEKDVHPHLTLARTRGRARLPRSIVGEVPDVDGAWTAERALVMRSHLGGDGARYEEVAAVPLEP